MRPGGVPRVRTHSLYCVVATPVPRTPTAHAARHSPTGDWSPTTQTPTPTGHRGVHLQRHLRFRGVPVSGLYLVVAPCAACDVLCVCTLWWCVCSLWRPII